MTTLEKLVQLHPSFWLWLTSAPVDYFPVLCCRKVGLFNDHVLQCWSILTSTTDVATAYRLAAIVTCTPHICTNYQNTCCEATFELLCPAVLAGVRVALEPPRGLKPTLLLISICNAQVQAT